MSNIFVIFHARKAEPAGPAFILMQYFSEIIFVRSQTDGLQTQRTHSLVMEERSAAPHIFIVSASSFPIFSVRAATPSCLPP